MSHRRAGKIHQDVKTRIVAWVPPKARTGFERTLVLGLGLIQVLAPLFTYDQA